MKARPFAAGLCVLWLLLPQLASATEEGETLRVTYRRMYTNGETIDLGSILSLDEHLGKRLESLTIVYDSGMRGKRLAWLVNGVTQQMDDLDKGGRRKVSFAVSRILEPELRLEALVVARQGAVQVRVIRAQFAADPAQETDTPELEHALHIEAIVPCEGPPGIEVSIRTDERCCQQGRDEEYVVHFAGGSQASVTSRHERGLSVEVPQAAISGAVTITGPAGSSNSMHFEIRSPR